MASLGEQLLISCQFQTHELLVGSVLESMWQIKIEGKKIIIIISIILLQPLNNGLIIPTKRNQDA